MATTQRPRPKTWSLLGDVKRRPSSYEATAAKFNYHYKREPAPFEMDPQAPFNRLYLEHREGSPFTVEDWEGFKDPAKLTYADYVMLQHDRETYVDLLTDHHEAAESVAALDPAWVATLRDLFVPLRFPLHVLQMTGLYVGQMAPTAFIINCANFQAADELRRIQRIAYHTKSLAVGHGDDLAETSTARGPWEQSAAWQPLRETLERLLTVRDWGEAFVALNVAVKPALDAVVDQQLSELASRNGDEYLSLLMAEFQLDAQRSRDWTTALLGYAVEQDPAMADVVAGWLATWQPRAHAAVAGLAPLFGAAPNPLDPALVVAAADDAVLGVAAAATR
ncbi:toluene monooxygenase [Phycicoccus sp. HDW14]|uniref:toluene monooxygenase n=1 Tax=Phycicoccus sp. HDW14 TaxID=2714941 RepID=UPI00197B6B7E|nr:toluene monooxygenase [Phycicoccus sp. HDW14]